MILIHGIVRMLKKSLPAAVIKSQFPLRRTTLTSLNGCIRLCRVLQLKRMLSTDTDPNDVLFENVTSKGIIILNRPRALNSLNASMLEKIVPTLIDWKKSKSFVIVKSSSDKAFCAGGDVVSVTKDGPSGSKQSKAFFYLEYRMNYIIGTYPLGYISFLDGIVMGGGVGLSVHGRYRIATENSVFAMPETAIGLFPDVGATYVLPRLKGKLGLFLGLTGFRLKGKDLVKAGIATHYCERANLNCVLKNIINLVQNDREQQDLAVKRGTMNIDDHRFCLVELTDCINEVFAASSIEEIFDRLEAKIVKRSQWALMILKTLKKMSPLSLKITLKALERGANLELGDCLKMEYRICCHILDAKHSTDFYEGVRAMLVDKDHNPKWKPSELKDISDDMVNDYFALLPPDEELKFC